ncbi:MAG: aminotransferase class IV [Gammaproteobacteria bacterium]|nr:aminotransferase class IV [Gammaproteobacteria bacterium]
MSRKIWRDGDFIDWEAATVHILSQSLQRGSLAFDYTSVHHTDKGTAIFRLTSHIDRLMTTCGITGLPLSYSKEELIEACAETVRQNPGAMSLKISAIIPSVEVELVPQDPTVSVLIAAYDSQVDIIDKNQGVYHSASRLSLKIARDISNRREDIIPPQAKVAANYTSPMIEKWKARKEGFDDILLLDAHGNVAEAPTSNIFIVDGDGNLATPPAQKVLLGITRASIMEMAPSMGITSREEELVEEDLYSASEVFLSASSIGVWPVVKIDGKTIGNGDMGTVSSRLKTRLRKIKAGEDPEFEHWLHYV